MDISANFPAFHWIPAALFLIAGLYAILAWIGWQRRVVRAALLFAGLMLAVGWWSLGYGLELAAASLPEKLLWARFQYVGIDAAPLFWMAFALEYTGRHALLTRRNWLLASILPLFILLSAWTNELHRWIWVATPPVEKFGLTLIDYHYGPLVALNAVYSYLFLLGGGILILIDAVRAPRLYRSQAIASILAVVVPLVGNLIYLIFHQIFPLDIDITLFFFLPSGIALAWALGRYRLLDIVPPAQNAILQSLEDGVILLGRERRVLYMNKAAETIFGKKADECLGQAAEQAFILCDGQAGPWDAAGGTAETALTVGGMPRQYEVRVTPMQSAPSSGGFESASHVVIFHDATERKEAESALQRREAILRAVSLAAELFLKSPDWEQNVTRVLEQLGKAAQASRVYIFECHKDERETSLVSQRYEWAAEGIQPQIDNPALQNQEWTAAGFARWDELLQNHQAIAGCIREFPASEQGLLSAQGILSLAVMPIFVKDELWGFIGFDECLHERDWSEAELGALHAAADIFGAALTRRVVELRLLKRQHSQELLQEIIRASLGKNDLFEVSQFLIEHLGVLIRADHCFLSLWNEIEQRVVPVASYGIPSDQYRAMNIQPGEKTLTASSLEAGHILVEEDVQNSPFVSTHLARQFGTRSILVIPLISNERKLGALMLGFIHPHHFTPEEIIISEQAADLAALVLAKFQAMEESNRRAEEAETLRRAGAAVAETLDLRDATTRLLEQLAFVVPHDSASVQLLRGNELEIIGGEGWDDTSKVIGMRFPIPGDNPNTVVIETRRPYLLHEIEKVYPAFTRPPHNHIHSWLGAPLLVRNEIIGLLAIDSRDPFHFTADDIHLVEAFAGQVAVAIENARLFDETQKLAITDGLTGLYNRRHFLQLAQIEFERARRYKRDLSALIFDIDHFKQVNDTYGHPVGDKVLQAIADLCRKEMREADPVCRYGGEEFAALLVETDGKGAVSVGERLRAGVEKLAVPRQNENIQVTISIGIAEQNENTPNLEALLARADQALYVAKHKGRNRVILGR